MTQQLIENLNDLIQYAGGEIAFQGRFGNSIKLG